MLIMQNENGFGASVEIDDPQAICSEGTARVLRAALTRYRVLALRQVTTELDVFGTIARALGDLVSHDFVSALRQDDGIHEIYKAPDHVHNFGGTWHSDGAYLKRPPRAIILQAIEVPETGGDTVWACQFAAHAALPLTLKNDLRGRTVTHAAAPVFGGYAERPAIAAAQSAKHPLFRWIPDHGEIALFHSGPCAQAITGLSAHDSAARLEEIMGIASTALTFRHSWRSGDIVIWDNRSTMHKALNDYHGQPRRMRRAMLDSEKPLFGP
jgi:taurine dioxygenase